MQFDSKPSPTPAAKPASEQATAALFNQALRAAQSGKYAEAEILYRKLVARDPKAAGAWANLGLLLGRLQRPSEGIDCLNRAIALEPATISFMASRALLEWGAGRLSAAIQSAKTALAAEPKNPTALRALSGALLAQQDWAGAVVPLRTWNSLTGGKDPQVLGSLVTALMQSGALADALPLARKLKERVPKDANAALMLGDLAGRVGTETKNTTLIAEAQRAYQQAFMLDPSNVRAGLSVAHSAELLGDSVAAERSYLAVTKRAPKSGRAHHELGRFYLRSASLAPEERVIKAEPELETAFTLEPQNAEFATSFAYVLLTHGKEKADRAANLFRIALKKSPRDLLVQRGLAEALILQKSYGEAASVYRGYLSQSPNDNAARRRYAGTLLLAGKKDEAYGELRELARRQPNDTVALRELASYLENDSRLPEAQTALEQALGRTPKDTTILVSLGLLLDKRGDISGAKARFEAAIALKPTETNAHVGLVQLLEKKGEKTEALAARERWVKLDPQSNAARYELAMVYDDLGRTDDAVKMLKTLTLVKGDPNRLRYRLALADLWLRRKNPTEEVAELRRVLAEEPLAQRDLQVRLASALERAGKPDDAEGVWQALLKPAPSDLSTRLGLAAFHERTGKLELAATEYEELAATPPRTREAALGVFRVRTAQKRMNDGLSYIADQALADNFVLSEALADTLQQLCTEQKQPERYLAFTQKATEKFKDSPFVWRRRARALTELLPKETSKAEALDAWRRVLKLAPKDPEALAALGGKR